jgi:hypothetical protein
MERKEFYSVKEVAHILELSPDRVYEYLRRGLLHGSRLAERSTWRIPASELERLGVPHLGKLGNKKGRTEFEKLLIPFDLAVQLQRSLSLIGPKDWAVWQFPDARWLFSPPPMSTETSPAELRPRIERGKLEVDLAIEHDKRFPLLILLLKATFPEFKKFEEWKQSVIDFVSKCQAITHEIWLKAENETGMEMKAFDIPDVGGRKGRLLNVPKFIYEFALDNHMTENSPRLELLPNDLDPYKLVPKGLPQYVLAVGSEEEMGICLGAVVSLTKRYVKDDRIGKIKTKTIEIKKCADPFQGALSTFIKSPIGAN